jgi:hypothetical protein
MRRLRLRAPRPPRTWLVAGFVLFNLGAAALIAPVAVDDGDDASAAADAGSAAAGDVPAEPTSPLLLDAQIVEEGGEAWAVGTSADGVAMPRFERGEDGTWEQVGDAFATSPAWASQGGFGPAVVQDGDTWWLFFAAPSAETGRYCVGAASTQDPADGFEPEDDPLRCVDDKDVIDASAYRGDEGLVLTWTERSLIDADTGDTGDDETTTTTEAAETEDETWEILGATLDLDESDASPTLSDGTVLLSASTAEDADGWEAGVIDAPALVDVDGTLVLLYGGNRWGSAEYAAGYAVCTGVLGPCERRTVDEPLDITLDEAEGAGGLQPVISSDAEPAAAFHTLLVDETSGQTAAATFQSELSWRAGALRVAEPTELDLAAE